MCATILVVEDNRANLELLMYLLSSFGHEPIAAEDGRSALEIARRQPFDLILCDLQLPLMDGYELVSRFRKESPLRDVPLIAVTAFAMPGDRERAIAAGCDGYIPKPIDPETFVAQLDPFLTPDKRSRGPRIRKAQSSVKSQPHRAESKSETVPASSASRSVLSSPSRAAGASTGANGHAHHSDS